jgi:hypothetical protein
MYAVHGLPISKHFVGTLNKAKANVVTELRNKTAMLEDIERTGTTIHTFERMVADEFCAILIDFLATVPELDTITTIEYILSEVRSFTTTNIHEKMQTGS